MKNVYTSWNIDLLADTMINKIKDNWKTPFESPAVVFTDPKTEQWFKLHWLKRNKASNSILMNLKTLRIQQFLFDIISGNQESEKLSVELLRDLLISKLTAKTAEGKFYFETLGSKEVDAYLKKSEAAGTEGAAPATVEDPADFINTQHLYDFSQTIASLFLDYEDTRPDSLTKLLEKCDWQKKLYNDTIGEKGIEIDGVKYLTLYQLANLNKKENGSGALNFNWPSNRPVFIFGFSGLGQIYRNILEDFSKENHLEIFLQTSDYEDNPANTLIGKWAGFGREHLRLWSKDIQVEKLEDAACYADSDSILHRTQKAIAENKAIEAKVFNSKEDTSLTLTGVPNRLREIENVHSKICQLLSEGNGTDGDKKTKTQLGDILVVASHIQDYKTAIEQVFDQNDQYSGSSAFPYIPYILADYSGERSLTAEALDVLFGILNKGYLSRSDAFKLLHNYLVQTVRGITDAEVSIWGEWVSQLNVFRDRAGHKDWQKAKNRLLLSRLTNDLVTASDDSEYLPFETIQTQDSDSLNRFISAVDELLEWTKFSPKNTGKQEYSIEDIDALHALLEKWLLTGDNTPKDLVKEALIFQNVVEEIERQKLTAAPYVFTSCFENALFDRSNSVSLSSSNILSSGITFANFESNRVLSAKHVFFLGLDSKAFPGTDSINELDIRKNPLNPHEREPGDESVPLKNRNAFLCQLMAAREGFYISYINKDLQKDEDFFKSSVLADLFDTIYLPDETKKDSPSYEQEVSLDETREWDKLYTLREFRNKKNYEKLQESGNGNNEVNGDNGSASSNGGENDKKDSVQNPADGKKPEHILPDRVSISKLKRYLTDPFIFRAEQLFNCEEDDSDEELREYEPIFLDRLTSAALRKKLTKANLDPKKQDEKLSDEAIKRDLRNQNLLPDSFFGDTVVKKVFDNVKMIYDKIIDNLPEAPAFEFNGKVMHTMNAKRNWNLCGALCWYNKDYKESGKIKVLDLNNSENYLSGYITSLALLAQIAKEKTKTYDVTLYVAGIKDYTAVLKAKEYSATPQKAVEILNELYTRMFDEQKSQSVPYSLMEEEIEKTEDDEKLTFSEFTYKLNDENQSEWGYFSKRNFFDKEKDVGYTADTFKDEWEAAIQKQKDLILYL